jgi:hypothetical protein
MAKLRDIETLQKFASVHASIHNHFHQDRHLNRRTIFKRRRSGRNGVRRSPSARHRSRAAACP